MILILILAILFVACVLFIVLPKVVDSLVDAYDEWQEVLGRIKRRAKK
jgi:hypothetical protein